MEKSVPNGAMAFVQTMSQWNSNVVRIETSGANTAGPGQVISIPLVSQTVVDLKSFRIRCDFVGSQNTTANVTLRAPSFAESLIQSVEIYSGGVLLNMPFVGYNQVANIKRLLNSTPDRDLLDDSLYHGTIDAGNRTSTDTRQEKSSFFIKPFLGLFESDLRYLNLNAVADIVIRITLAPASVCIPKADNIDLGVDLEASGNTTKKTAAAGLTYTLNNIAAYMSVVDCGPVYHSLFMERLASEPYISFNQKDYAVFTDTFSGTTSDLRFSLSASSVDCLYVTFSYGNRDERGIKSRNFVGGKGTRAVVANAFYYDTFSGAGSGSTAYNSPSAEWSASFTINGAKYPVHLANTLDFLHSAQMVANKHGLMSSGWQINSLADFQKGKAVLTLPLNCPSEGIGVKSGYATLGNSSSMSFNVMGQTFTPSGDAAAQAAAQVTTNRICSCYAEMTTEIRISANRQTALVP